MTATTYGARDHARAQADARVLGMPTIPAAAAADLPAGVEPDQVLWDEVLDAGEYAAHALPRGACCGSPTSPATRAPTSRCITPT